MIEETLPVAAGNLVYAAMFGVLVAISVIDGKTRRIPNALVFALFVLRLFMLIIEVTSGQGARALKAFGLSIMGAAGAVLLFVIVKRIVDRASGKDSLGWGDVKLIAAGALFLTPSQTFGALCIACFGALLMAVWFRWFRNDSTFPFGPALCLGIAWGVFL